MTSSNPFLSRFDLAAVATYLIKPKSTLGELWAKADRPGVRAFVISIVALAAALLLAFYSSAAAELGQVGLATTAAMIALAISAWVALTLVPVLARRTPLRWIGQRIEFHITREGWIFMLAVLLVSLTALNTGNNLLFLVLASLIAIVLMSGILSSITLSGVAARLELPEHIFAGQRLRGVLELQNEKLTLPSFSLRADGAAAKGASPAAMLSTPVYFPYLPKQERVQQVVPMIFPERGLYRQDAFRLSTRFPFGFLQKSRRVDLRAEALVYPSVEPSPEYLEILPGIEGALESHLKGHGQDLYALREYVPTDPARHVHWKASARSGFLMVREFTHEEDFRVLLVFDPHLPIDVQSGANWQSSAAAERFAHAVTICASLAWHFYERNSIMQYRSAGMETSLVAAGEVIFDILRHLALVQPLPHDPKQTLMSDLSASIGLFKLIVTTQPRGSVPASVWSTSYVIFLDEFDF